MTWLHDVHAGVFFFLLGMALLLAAMGAGGAFWAGRITRALRGRTAVPVNALTEGYQLVSGTACGPLLKAPLSGQVCVWWERWVWEQTLEISRDTDGDRDQRVVWKERIHDHSSRVIQYAQGFATCAVQPTGMTLTVPTQQRDWTGMQYPPENSIPAAQPGTVFGRKLTQGSKYVVINNKLQGDRFRYLEQLIVPQSPLFVLGRVQRVDPAQWADVPREAADSGVPDADMADDADNDDWDDESERQHAADMRQVQWLVDKEKGRPYIVSVQQPDQWLDEPAQVVKAGWIMAVVLLGVSALMLWARFGVA